MNPQIKYVTLSTRVTVEYIENGALAGSPLLLLHGLSDSWHSFLPLLPHLPPDVRTLAFTQRGHGQSSKPRGDYHSKRWSRTRSRSSTPCTSNAPSSPATRWAPQPQHCSPQSILKGWQASPCSAHSPISAAIPARSSCARMCRT